MTARTLTSFSLVLLLSGCGGLIARSTYEGMSPEEIAAIANTRLQVVRCFRLGGPPLGGSSMSIMYPHTAKGTISFSPGPDCQVQKADIDLMGDEPEVVEAPKPFKVDPNEFNPKPRAVQPPPKLKSDFILKTPSGSPAIRVKDGLIEGWEPGFWNNTRALKQDPCDTPYGATGQKWLFCE